MQSIPAARDLSDKAQLQGEKTATQCPNGGCMFWTLGSAGALLIQLETLSCSLVQQCFAADALTAHRDDLIAERIHGPIGLAQIVILVHLVVEVRQLLEHAIVVGRIGGVSKNCMLRGMRGFNVGS